MTQIVAYALIGKLTIFLLQGFPKNSLPFIGRFFREGRLLDELFSCDLCLGFWVYSGLAFIMNMNMVAEYFYIPVLSEFVTGAIMSFIMHLISAGWEARYSNIIIE
jgi:hypothetical protein